MKKLLPLLLAATLLAPAVASAASFEGKVSIKITPPSGQSQQLSMSVKDTMTRMEMPASPAGAMSAIMDATKHQVTVLMHQQHMYMVQPLPEPRAATPGSDSAPAAARTEPVLEKTGTTEKILGYDCVKYVVARNGGATDEIWITDQLGTFSLLGMTGGGATGPGMRGGSRGGAGASGQGWERLLQGKEMFPLRVVSTSADGKVSRFEVVSLEKAAQPAADFAPPADYQDMSQMMKGMGMPPGMRPPSGG